MVVVAQALAATETAFGVVADEALLVVRLVAFDEANLHTAFDEVAFDVCALSSILVASVSRDAHVGFSVEHRAVRGALAPGDVGV